MTELPTRSVPYEFNGPAYDDVALTTNMGNHTDYGAQRSIDLFTACRGWFFHFTESGELVTYLKDRQHGTPPLLTTPMLDANNYVSRWPTIGEDLVRPDTGTTVQLPAFNRIETVFHWGTRNGSHRAGDWILKWEGEGSVSISSGNGITNIDTSTPNQITFTIANQPGEYQELYVRLNSINEANYPRGFTLMKQANVALHTAGQFIDPQYRNDLRDFNLIYLRMLNTAGINSSGQVNWADRPQPGAIHRGGSRMTWEQMVKVCNETPVPMWVLVPHQANEDYVTQLATLIRDNLDPLLPIMLEFSNETWAGFGQRSWLGAQAETVWGAPPMTINGQANNYDSYHSYHGKLHVRNAKIFNTVFGAQAEARLNHVLAGQAAGSYPLARRLLSPEWEQYEPLAYEPPHTYCSHLTWSNYFGTEVIGNEATRAALAAILLRGAVQADNYADAGNAVFNWSTGAEENILVVGDWDASTLAFPTTRPDTSAIKMGDTWNVTGAGSFAGRTFAVGDRLVARKDAPGTSWSGNWASYKAPLNYLQVARIGWNANMNLAKQYNKQVLAYEGGTHMLQDAFLNIAFDFVPFFGWFAQQPQYRTLYEIHVANWRAVTNGAPMSQYLDMGSLGKFGDWGLRRHVGQPILDFTHAEFWSEFAPPQTPWPWVTS